MLRPPESNFGRLACQTDSFELSRAGLPGSHLRASFQLAPSLSLDLAGAMASTQALSMFHQIQEKTSKMLDPDRQ